MLLLLVSDEKEKYDPNAFRDNVLQGFTAADSNLEQVRDQISTFVHWVPLRTSSVTTSIRIQRVDFFASKSLTAM